MLFNVFGLSNNPVSALVPHRPVFSPGASNIGKLQTLRREFSCRVTMDKGKGRVAGSGALFFIL